MGDEGRTMENNNFLLRVRSNYNQFTQVEKRVADFVLKNKKEVLYMSISDLAAACGVGDTSVFRFCKKMKLKGYQDFRRELSLCINENAGESEENKTKDISPDDSFEVYAKKIMQNNMNALSETFMLLDKDVFMRVMDYFEAAQDVYFFGVGASMLSAMFAFNKFLRITTKVHCAADIRMQTMMSSMLTENCLAVVISYSGSSKESIQFAKLAKSSGARVVCISKYYKSGLSAYADEVLLCGINEEGLLLGASTSSYMGRLYLLELMYLEYYNRQRYRSELNHIKSTAAFNEDT